MCFETKGSELKRAEKDIICYKVMREVVKKPDGEVLFFLSYHRGFKYYPEIVYKGKSELNMKFCYYTNIDISKGGYHSFIYKEDALSWLDDPVVECVIPKGSLYLENKIDRQYCSTAIQIINVIGYPLKKNYPNWSIS